MLDDRLSPALVSLPPGADEGQVRLRDFEAADLPWRLRGRDFEALAELGEKLDAGLGQGLTGGEAAGQTLRVPGAVFRGDAALELEDVQAGASLHELAHCPFFEGCEGPLGRCLEKGWALVDDQATVRGVA